MGNNKAKGRMSARRAAAFLGVLGALVMSSGIALMVAATPANAVSEGNTKYFVCKYVGTPNVDERLQTGQNPISTSENAIGEDPVVVGSFFNDAHGRSYVLAEDTGQPEPDVSACPAPAGGDTPTTAGVSFTDPTCTTGPSYAGSNTSSVDYAVTSGSVAAGASVTITATAKSGFVLSGTSSFNHTFTTPTGCTTSQVSTPTTTSVSPPKAHVKAHVKTKAKAQVAAVTPTVVHAGLTSVSAQDLRGEQGLALMVAGMVMLVAAGGLGLRIRGAAARI